MKPEIKTLLFADIDDARFRKKVSWGDIHAVCCMIILCLLISTLVYLVLKQIQLPTWIIKTTLGAIVAILAIMMKFNFFSQNLVFGEQYISISLNPKKFNRLRNHHFSELSNVNKSDIAWMETKELFESYP